MWKYWKYSINNITKSKYNFSVKWQNRQLTICYMFFGVDTDCDSLVNSTVSQETNITLVFGKMWPSLVIFYRKIFHNQTHQRTTMWNLRPSASLFSHSALHQTLCCTAQTKLKQLFGPKMTWPRPPVWKTFPGRWSSYFIEILFRLTRLCTRGHKILGFYQLSKWARL